MTSDASKSPEQVPEFSGDTRAAPPSGDRLAADLRGFGPFGIVTILVIVLSGNVNLGNVVVPVGAILVLVWARWSRTPWRDIGYVRPKNWTGTLAVGLAFGIAFKFLLKAIVMPLLGADPINQAYHYLARSHNLLTAALLNALRRTEQAAPFFWHRVRSNVPGDDESCPRVIRPG